MQYPARTTVNYELFYFIKVSSECHDPSAKVTVCFYAPACEIVLFMSLKSRTESQVFQLVLALSGLKAEDEAEDSTAAREPRCFPEIPGHQPPLTII